MKRKLILGGDPEEKFTVPSEKLFEEQGDFIEAAGCEKIGEALIEKLECFKSLADAKIIYLWRRQGSTKPKMLLGKCQRPSGLLRHFSACDFIVWFAANNCRELELNRWQIEALVFHELKHAKMEPNRDGVEVPVSVPHDWEGFAQEIERYGLWKRDIQPIAAASAKALQLPFDAPEKSEGNPAGDQRPRLV